MAQRRHNPGVDRPLIAIADDPVRKADLNTSYDKGPTCETDRAGQGSREVTMPDERVKEFEGFFERHRRHLVHYLARLVTSPDIAEDLTQEAFARVYVVPDGDLRSPRSFLYRTAHNLAMDHIRHQRVAAAEPLSDLLTDTLGDEAPSAEARTGAREELRLIQAAIEQLPPKCRMVFILLRLEGWSYKEIAVRMSLSETMVRKYAARALAHCRAALDSQSEQAAHGAKSPGSAVTIGNDPGGERRR